MIVRVYWNLHKKCWSIQHKRKVISHKKQVALINVKFIVSEAGRQRVLKERRKNVHAFAQGELLEEDMKNDYKVIVSYNPYKFSYFYEIDNLKKIESCEKAILGQNKKIYVKQSKNL